MYSVCVRIIKNFIISFTRFEGRDHTLWYYEEKVSGNQCHKTTSTNSEVSSQAVRSRAVPGDHSGKVLSGKTHETTAVSFLNSKHQTITCT